MPPKTSKKDKKEAAQEKPPAVVDEDGSFESVGRDLDAKAWLIFHDLSIARNILNRATGPDTKKQRASFDDARDAIARVAKRRADILEDFRVVSRNRDSILDVTRKESASFLRKLDNVCSKKRKTSLQ